MADIWLISDSHFGHKNIVKFTRPDGSKLRPWDTIEEHDAAIIDNWNKTVKPQDKVYHLGDFGLASQAIKRVAPRLMGHKRLILGNHDEDDFRHYLGYFEKVSSYRILDKIVFSHIPIHPYQLETRFKGNAHGHSHGYNLPDKRYFNCSVENINYTPIHFEDVKKVLL